MLQLLMEVLQAVALPVMMLTIVISGCGGDSRPKKDQHSKSKSKKHRSGKGKSKSDKSSKRKKKGHSSRSSKSGKSKSISRSKKKSKVRSGSSSKSLESTFSSKKRSRSKKGRSSKSDSRASTSASKRPPKMGVVDSRSISRAIGAEPPKEMMMEPAELHWSTTGGIQKVVITNPTDERRAVKVKCSDNNLYRVNPVFSFIEPGQSLGIDIVRQNGGAKVDKMVFVTTKARPEDVQPRELFTAGVANPMMVLPLIAV